jgi:hypothetical protein
MRAHPWGFDAGTHMGAPLHWPTIAHPSSSVASRLSSVNPKSKIQNLKEEMRMRNGFIARKIGLFIVTLIIAVSATPSTAATASPAPQTFPTSRDPLKWPFKQGSIWNMPIGSNAQYIYAGIGWPTQYGMTSDEDIIIMEPNAPLKDVVVNNAGWDGSKTRCGSIQWGQLVFSQKVPVPNDFRTDPGYQGSTPNHSAAILMPDGQTIKQTQPFHVCGFGGTVTSQYAFPDDNIITGDGIQGAHGGSGMSSLGGTIRVGELVPGGVIRHALKLNLFAKKYLSYNNDGSRGYRWPALRADGYAGDSGHPCGYGGRVSALEMGALLALKPDFNVGGLRTDAAKIIAQAFKDYGGYVTDDTCWDVYGIETEWGSDGRVTDEFRSRWGFDFDNATLPSCTNTSDNNCRWVKDLADIFTNLHVVNNNNSSNIGGGGTPRQPLAPPFAGGGGGGGTNIVQNPGFESDFANWGNSAGRTSIVSDARTGSKAARLGDGSNNQGERQQNVSLNSGQSYTLSAYVKKLGDAWCSIGVKGDAGGSWFDFYNSGGGSSYTQVSKTFTAPSNINFAVLYIWKTAGTGTCTVDDVTLTAQ